MKIQLNADLRKSKKGDIITIEDRNGVPIDPFWKRRLKDSAIDGCITVLDQKKKAEAPQEEIKEEPKKEENIIDDGSTTIEEDKEEKPKKIKKK